MVIKKSPKREYRGKCKECGRMAKVYRMFDIDGTNLVEYLVCLECGLRTLVLL